MEDEHVRVIRSHRTTRPGARRATLAVLFALALVAAYLVGAGVTGQQLRRVAADPAPSCAGPVGTQGADGSFAIPLTCSGLPVVPAPTGSPTPTATPTPTPSGTPTPTPTAPSPTPTTPSPTPTTPSPSPTPPPTTPPPSPSPTPTPSPTSPAACPVAGKNVPGAADPWGGCWPGPGNTGVPATAVLTAYTGPCTITAAGTIIDSKTVTCATLDIRAANVVIRNSMLNGVDVEDGEASDSAHAGASFSISDSTVVNGARDQCACVGYHDFTALRVNVVGGNRSMYCELRCTITDSWLHAQQLQGAQHGSGLREEQFTTARHNVLVCDYPNVNDTTTLGCSADLTGYADFAPIHDNTISRNLLLSAQQGNCSTCQPGHPPISFCAYGGASGGKPFSGDPSNGTNQKFLENVFQRGTTRQCGDFGPISAFDTTRVGNVWQGNVFDDGAVVAAAM